MELFIENMSCGHCKMTIEKALTDAGVSSFTIDLQNKTVFIQSKELTKEAIIEIIEAKGYHVK